MRPYKCAHCGFLTHQINDLHEHLIAHSNCVGYFFHLSHRTAFPKWQNFDMTTQTDEEPEDSQCVNEFPVVKTEVNAFCDTKWDDDGDDDDDTVDNVIDFEAATNNDTFDNREFPAGFHQDNAFQIKNDTAFPECSISDQCVDFNDWPPVEQMPNVDDNFMQRLKKKEGSKVKLVKKRKSSAVKSVSDISDSLPNEGVVEPINNPPMKNIDNLTKENIKKPLGKLYKKEFDENDIEVHACTVCKFRCESKDQIIVHLSEHCVQNSQICEVCGLAVANKQALSNHKKNYCGRKHECDICGAMFCRPSRLSEHLRVHSGECPWVCDQCGKAFRTNSQLSKHQKCVHSSARNYQCSQCEKSFKIPWLLRKHERTHNQVLPYTCQFCGKRFGSKWNMKAHMRRHTGEKPYQCVNCGESFAHNVVRKSHQAKCFSAPVVDNI